MSYYVQSPEGRVYSSKRDAVAQSGLSWPVIDYLSNQPGSGWRVLTAQEIKAHRPQPEQSFGLGKGARRNQVMQEFQTLHQEIQELRGLVELLLDQQTRPGV